jgi:hypoxanthine phosphoribosyltransferase
MVFATEYIPDDFLRHPVNYGEIEKFDSVNVLYRGLLDCKMIDEADIARQSRALALTLADRLQGTDPLAITVLKGATDFSRMLLKELDHYRGVPIARDPVQAKSMEGTKSSGIVRITRNLNTRIAGRDLVIVEDIVDTGLTVQGLIDHYAAHDPRSIVVVSMLHKRIPKPALRKSDFTLFSIPDEFVVGYGLDYEQHMRRLPHVYVLNDQGKARYAPKQQ